jgi:HEAT repeat protein
MNRIWLVLGFLGMCVFGCSPSAPPPAPPPPKSDTTTYTAPAPPPATTKLPDSQIERPATGSVPSGDPRLRDLAARLLESDGQGGWHKNEKAATELEKLTPDELQQLWPLLKDAKPEVRRGAAVFLLEKFDPADREQVAAFSALLNDGDRMVRGRALDAVRQFSHEEQISVLPRLIEMLDPAREDRPENRVAVARLCSSLKNDTRSAVTALARSAVSDPEAKVRAAALVAATQMSSPEESASLLSKALDDSDASVRLVAAARLRQLGSAAAPAAKPLARVLADQKPDVAEAAGEALIRIGPAAVEPVAGQLASKSASARKLALACLVRIGPAAKSAVPQIEKLKQDPDPQVRQLANTALKQFSGQ